MRSSAALLIAAALTASAAPLPVKVEQNLITPKVTVRAPQPMNVFKHRHYDSVKREAKEKRTEIRAREALNSYQHRHYHAAVARDEGDRHRHHGHGHWTESGTWVHSGTSFPTGTGAPSQTVSATDSSSVPTVSANTAPGFPGGKNCHTSSTDVPTETSAPTDPTTVIEVTSTVIVTESSSTEVSTPPVVTESSSTESAPTTTQAPSTTVAPVTTAAPVTTQAPTTTSASTTTNPNADAYLGPHNDARAQHSANPVTWSDELASMAQTWVNNCNWQHSGGSLASFGYGENLAAGTGQYAISDAVASWVNEGQNYNANDPVNESTLHYTQVVWKATTEIGCAYADCPAGSGPFDASYGSWRLHSCEYTPQGNVIGEFADNVS